MPKKPPRAGLRFLLKLRGRYNSADSAKAVIEEYGRFVKLGPFGKTYLLADAEGVEDIFLKNKSQFSKDVPFYYPLMTLFGRGLLTSEGKRWKAKREWFQPLFTPKHILQYAQTTIDTAERFFARWDAMEGEVIDFSNETLMVSLAITVKVFFHEDWSFEQLSKMIDSFNMQHYGATDLKIPGVRSDWEQKKKITEANAYVNQMAEELLLRHEHDTHENLATKLYAFRDPETGAPYPKEDLIDEVKTFLGTGHDTVGTVMSWAWHSLLTHPEAHHALQREVDTVLAKRHITIGDLEDLPYTLMVFNEAARLYPPIWVIPRKPLDDIELMGYPISKGSVILTVPYVLQRLKDYWQDPDEFKPERFSKTSGDGHPKHAFIPFGAGPRICIARVFAEQQGCLLLAMMAQRYEFELMEESIDTPCNSMITLKPFKPIKIKMKRR